MRRTMSLLLVASTSTLAHGCGPAPASPKLPGGSFEEQPCAWMMGPTSTIQNQVTHGGSRALEIRLDHGLGSRSVTRSPYLTDVAIGPEYEITFYYRYEKCASAVFTVQAGDHEKRLQLDGSDAAWRRESMVVSFAKKPAWVDITAGRVGAASSYEGPQFDNNVLWIDDIEIALKK